MSRFPAKDDPDRAAFLAGYRAGELERIALAAANSELRSEILALRCRLLKDQAATLNVPPIVLCRADAPHLPAGRP